MNMMLSSGLRMPDGTEWKIESSPLGDFPRLRLVDAKGVVVFEGHSLQSIGGALAIAMYEAAKGKELGL